MKPRARIQKWPLDGKTRPLEPIFVLASSSRPFLLLPPSLQQYPMSRLTRNPRNPLSPQRLYRIQILLIAFPTCSHILILPQTIAYRIPEVWIPIWMHPMTLANGGCHFVLFSIFVSACRLWFGVFWTLEIVRILAIFKACRVAFWSANWSLDTELLLWLTCASLLVPCPRA